MDSGLAVVIGAVVAFAGTVLGPWLLDRSKRRTEAEASRRAELSSLIPELFESLDRNVLSSDGETERLVRAQLLLKADEAPIGNMLIIASTHRANSGIQASARTSVAMWFRGQRTVEEVTDAFERTTGVAVRAER